MLGKLTIFPCYREGVPGALEAGPSDDEFRASDLAGAVYHAAQVVFVSLFSIVHTPEYGIGKVDSDLRPVSLCVGDRDLDVRPGSAERVRRQGRKGRTSMYLGL